MAYTMKMDYYINVELREGSRHWTKNSPIQKVGMRTRHTTMYIGGDPSKVVSQDDVKGVYIIKDSAYKKVSIDTFLALYRTVVKKSA